MSDPEQVSALLKQLDAQKNAYLDTFRQVHELLARNIAATAPVSSRGNATPPRMPLPEIPEPRSPRSPRQSVSRSISERDPHARKTSAGLATLTTSSESRRTGEDSDTDNDETLYVSTTLEPFCYTEESLREHLRSYKYHAFGAKILHGVIDNPSRLRETPLVTKQKGPVDDRSHLSHYQIFDIGPDGAPLPVEKSNVEEETSRANAIWQCLREINQPPKERLAVGRITILREPSPMLFGAVHHVFDKYLDVNELFRHLVESNGSSANVHRAYDEDVRKQRSFVFNFEFFTIIGENCQPMKWQLADQQGDKNGHHIPVARCSSVVALVLNGPAVRKVRNPARRATDSHGYVYDPWSSWHVLNLQCYSDWNASTEVHDSSKHYVNGVEAFLITVLGEFRDAQKRFEAIYNAITDLITPPLEFMFNSNIRDTLLFEDQHFTLSRRYFWASQTLGLMNESIRKMIEAYEDTFTDEVWEGTHKTLWPLLERDSDRNQYYRRRLASLKAKFETEVRNLQKQIDENDERRREIQSLKEELFTGTSIQESRKSVENTEITIQQGHNIKLLTLVSIFFLPLTFVTSVFGMTNMPTDEHYWTFGIVTACVCVPFFVLIGSLNTTKGMHWWHVRSSAAFRYVGNFFAWLFRRRSSHVQEVAGDLGTQTASFKARPSMSRSSSAPNTRDMRLRRWSSSQTGDTVKQSVEMKPQDRPHIGSVRPAVARAQKSRLVEMWELERRRTLQFT
ncbi:hypothetical protein BAUCODRAFT_144829 [Baudoinia panamericana UAMH 10762]|uniref:Uncharacterized protein n=1 Tax=Baudoinia panamericana (strain UAMH 10762) TaxID=717646 RepID=M2NQG3_BAUPA|nr:uncharacterized protein BAUCODRAFT_144829 [Baudoinia panamericana UAMH 10762]EMD01291.1 hypothetical protein BAUCODRAFT_144829 [Baudoinia panamericana UAMH 10762]